MVRQHHFESLFRGQSYKPSKFDNDSFNDFNILPLSRAGAVTSIARMARQLLKDYAGELEGLLNTPQVTKPDMGSWKWGSGWYPEMPTAKVLIFDIETLVKLGGYPVMACAVDYTGQAYIWTTPEYGQLIELPDNTLVIGHNVSFDAQGIASSFRGIEHGCRFIDTMTMANATWGFCSDQFWAARLAADPTNTKPLPIWAYKGYGASNFKSLKATFEWLYPDAPPDTVDKTIRDIFVEADSVEEIINNAETLIEYNIQDVTVTLLVWQKLYPEWRRKNPSDTTLMGHILSSSYKLPLTPKWETWKSQVDDKHSEIHEYICQALQDIAQEWLATGYQEDNPWHQHIDWTVKPKARKLKGYPEWYRKAMMSKQGMITLKSKLGHYLLEMQFEGLPAYSTKADGWRNSERKVPHPSGTGNVGYLFSDDLWKMFESGMLTSRSPRCQEILNLAVGQTYWASVQSRVHSVRVVDNWTLPQTGGGTITGRVTDPLWLTTCDPYPHLVGSELKSRIQCPPGYVFLNADFTGQEMRIAWTLGDSIRGEMGASPMSVAGISGDKADGTDAHSAMATKLTELIGRKYPRQDAKVINFSLLYMAGIKAVSSYLRIVCPDLDNDKANKIAKDAVTFKRGHTRYTDKGREYVGGTDSDAYNAIDKICNADYPRSPMLKREMSTPLCPRYVKDKFYTTRANWVVQGSARDQLDTVSVAFTFMAQYAGLKARLIWSRHDEVIVMCPESEVKMAGELLQQAHCFTWAALHESLGLYDMPTPGLLFDSIDVDTTVRKAPDVSLVTPSHPASDVSDGYSMSAHDFKGFTKWEDIKCGNW